MATPTTNYNLSQYSGNDIPKWNGGSAPNSGAPLLGTYNGDMKKIDNALKALDDALDILDAAVVKKVANSIIASYILNGEVTAEKLALNAVTELKILNGSVTKDKLGPDAVDSTKLADLAVGNEHLKDNSLDSRNYVDGSIDPEHLAAATISSISSPAGAIVAFAGSVAPTGWLMCDGSAKSRATYATLYAVLETKYGVGDGSTTFGLPNLAGRMIIMRNPADAGPTDRLDTLGLTGGAKQHTLITAEAPSHEHDIEAHNHVDTGHVHAIDPHDHKIQASADWGSSMTGTNHNYDYVNTSTGTRGTKVNTAGLTAKSVVCGLDDAPATTTSIELGNTNSVGVANSHQNLPPYFVLNYIIKT